MPDQTASDDWSGLGDLVTLTVERFAEPVEGMHRAIVSRWFDLVGPPIDPARDVYLKSVGAVYNSVRMTGWALGKILAVGGSVVQRVRPVPRLWDSRVGSGVQAVANAVWGDQLAVQASPLAIDMSMRDDDGAQISPTRDALALAFEVPTPRVVVLIHGLGETERCWTADPTSDEPIPGLARLLSSAGFTPLLMRYNTGRSVAENGIHLSDLLEDLFRAWPVALDEIALVGNSMGGLVARSAVQTGQSVQLEWSNVVRRLVTLGSPHLGAPLAKGAHLASLGLRVSPETRPLSQFLERRSAGLKDLRSGSIGGDDPQTGDEGGTQVVPEPEGITQHFIAGVLTGDPRHPLGTLLGDLIVRVPSGTGRGRRRRVEATHVAVIGGRRHSDLAGDPVVAEQVRQWLVAQP